VCHAASCLCSFLSAFTPGDEDCFSDQGRERGEKKEPSQTQSNMYPNNPSHRNRAPKMDIKGQFLSTSLPLLVYAKKKKA